MKLRLLCGLLAGVSACLPTLAVAGNAPVALYTLSLPNSATPVVVTPTTLFGAQRLSLALGGREVTLVRENLTNAHGTLHWEGHLEGQPGRRAVFDANAEGVTGSLDLPGLPLRLGYADHQQWLLPATEEQVRADAAPEIFVTRNVTTAGSTLTPGGNSQPGADEKPADVAYPVSLNLAALSNLAPGQLAVLTTDSDRYQISFDTTLVSPDGHATWVGHLTQYGTDYPVLLHYGPDGSATGSITVPQGELLLSGASGKEWLIDTAASGIRHNPTAKDGDAAVPTAFHGAAEGEQKGLVAGATVTTPAHSTAAAATPTTPTATGSTVDVLVLYTPGLVSRYGTDAGANNRLDYFIAMANKAYADSGVAITLRKVGTQVVNLTDANSNEAQLNALSAGSGAFSAIPALRNKLGADAVVLVRPFYMNGQGGNCGIAWVGGYGLSPMKASSESAFAVVSEGTDVQKSGYFCTDYTFAHELGHNMGLMHDRVTVASQGGGVGAFPYAYGYGRQGVFGTIMSYDYPVLGRFSSPTDRSCNGGACGVVETDTANSANNAKALGITRIDFADYRSATVVGQVSVAGVISVDGRAAAGVQVLANGSVCGTSAANGAYACSFAPGYTGTLSLGAVANVSFSPSSFAVSKLTASALQNFTGVSAPAKPVTFTIMGTVTINGRAPVNTTISAGTTGCTSNAMNGAYSCTVNSGWAGNLVITVKGLTPFAIPVKAVTQNLRVDVSTRTGPSLANK